MKIEKFYIFGRDWNIIKTETGILYEFMLPGFSNDDIKVSIIKKPNLDSVFFLKIEADKRKDVEHVGTHKAFTTSVTNNEAHMYNLDSCKFDSKDGILFVHIPYKVETKKPIQTINVKNDRINLIDTSSSSTIKKTENKFRLS